MAEPDELVREFLAEWQTARVALLACFPDVRGVVDIVAAVLREELPRSGECDSGVSYQVHGIGCEITMPSGRTIDIDIAPDGEEFFDVYRVRKYSAEVGRSLDNASVAELELACSRLVSEGTLRELRQGKYEPVL